MIGRPGDERGFVHRRIVGAIGGFIGGGPGGAIGGFLGGGSGGNGGLPESRFTPISAISSDQSATPFGQIRLLSGAIVDALGVFCPGTRDSQGICDTWRPLFAVQPNGNGAPVPVQKCDPGFFWNGQFCEFLGGPAGGTGEARMGRFGAGLEPSFRTINKRVCLPGMVLGKAGQGGVILCYNAKQLSNKERLWPKGAAPLLTGGEMSAIRKAATAAGKFQRAGKRLAAVGRTFSGPSSRGRKPTQRRIAGGAVKVLESGPGSVQL